MSAGDRAIAVKPLSPKLRSPCGFLLRHALVEVGSAGIKILKILRAGLDVFTSTNSPLPFQIRIIGRNRILAHISVDGDESVQNRP